MRRMLVVVLAAVMAAALGVTAWGAAFPARIDLPDGWQPEGIAHGRGNELFVGSIPTGAVLRIDARTGRRAVLVRARTGRRAIGLKVDNRRRLFVAGGPTGRAFVYSAGTGRPLRQFRLAPRGDRDTFVNDVALTRRAAYFTDSRRSVLYVVAANLRRGRELSLPDIPLTEGTNLNGIAAARGGRTLLAIQSSTGALWRIDARSGRAVRVDVGNTDLTNGDGILLAGRTLYVVRNRNNRIVVLRMSRDLRRGTFRRAITKRNQLDVPTTLARIGRRLFAVNARFGTADPRPTTDYWVTRLRR
jgi:sugar lactone lactonase YvrE